MTHFIFSLRHRDRRLSSSAPGFALVVVIWLIMLSFWMIWPADFPIRMPDTTSYTRFDPYRGAGYPFFLWLTQIFDLTDDTIIFIQLGLFFSALLYLALTIFRRLQSTIAAIAVLFGIGGNPLLVQYCFSLITESLFFTSLMLIAAIVHTPSLLKSRWRLAGIGGLMAWLILIKPVAWAFIGIPIILGVQLLLTKNLRYFTAFLAGIIIMFACGSAYRFHVHQQWLPGSFLGNQLIGKLAFSEFDPQQTPFPEGATHFHNVMAQAVSVRNERVPDFAMRFIYSLNIYDYLRFGKTSEILERENLEPAQHGPALTALSFSIIKQSPLDYLEEIAMSWYGLWFFGELQSAQFAANYTQLTNELKSSLPKGIQLYQLSGQNTIPLVVIKTFLALSFAINIILLLYALFTLLRGRPINDSLLGATILALMVQGYLLLTALLQAGLIRYAIAAWPLHIVVFVVVAIWTIDHQQKKAQAKQ